MTLDAPRARFDDLPGHTTTTLSGFERELRADELSDVVEVLADAEEFARRGWWVGGFVAYEAAPAFDAGLATHARDTAWAARLPLAWFGLYRAANTGPLSLPRRRASTTPTWEPLVPAEEYVKKVRSIVDDVGVGDLYQANLTTSLVARDVADPLALYRRLLIAQRPAYGAFIEFDGLAVASASPELFIDWDGTRLRSRPMKGTIRRGRFREEDDANAKALRDSTKESAENIMIVDLIRNDMGKVADVGSVAVTELLNLEPYPNVWQLVSEVRCTTRRDVHLVDIFGAMFPCGSVTGAPKQSAMAIIEREETSERGVYCGAVGLIEPSSPVRAHFNVAIRTAVVDRRRGEARYGSGGGIVADSVPDDELREMALKAEMLQGSDEGPFRLLETFAHRPGGANPNLARHLERLCASAAVFGFRVPSALGERVASKLTAIEAPSRIRLLVSRSGRLEFQCSPLANASHAPVRLVVDDETVDSTSIMLFHKTTARSLYRRRRRRFPSVDDVVMVNERSECTETTIANIAARAGSRWWTPPLSSGCLPGVERARLLEVGVLSERVLTPRDLRSADELAVISSLRGWRSAVLDHASR